MTAPWWWSWLLTSLGLLGLWLAGSQKRVGWGIGIATQLLWAVYAIRSQQYGFLVSATAYAMVYGRNFRIARAQREREGK